MLQAIRSHAGSWFIKFILAAIIASFALWGITDIIRGYGANRPVAVVGKMSISMEEFAHQFKQAINNLQNRFKGNVTAEQIKELKVGDQILKGMIYKAALEQELANAGIVISDATVTNEIRSIPAFLTKSGDFDMNQFNQILQSQGLTEKRFFNEMRSDLQQFQLFEGLTTGFELSDEYLEELYNALEQMFSFVALDIPFKKMATVKTPADADLQKFYEANKEAFRYPEFRTLTLLKFNRDAIQNQVQVTQEEITDEYNRRIAEFTTPEKRTIKQLTLSSPDIAQKAIEMFNTGKPVRAIARELNAGLKEIDATDKTNFASPYADLVFSLALGKPSNAIEAPNGWIVFVVEKIDAEQVKPLDAVRADLDKSLRAERFNDFIENLQNQIEDGLAGGSTFQEIATKYHLTIESIKAVNKAGKDETGKLVVDEGVAAELIEFAFSNNQGSDSQLILSKNTKDNLVGVIAKIEDVRPAHIPEFAQIRGKVLEVYQLDAQNKAAGAIAKEASAVTTIADLKKFASSNGLSVATLPSVSRASVDENQTFRKEFMPESVERMFSLAKSEAFVAPTRTGYKVIMVEKVEQPKTDKEKLDKFKQAMAEMYKRDFKSGFREYLTKAYPTTIHQEQVNHVVGES